MNAIQITARLPLKARLQTSFMQILTNVQLRSGPLALGSPPFPLINQSIKIYVSLYLNLYIYSSNYLDLCVCLGLSLTNRSEPPFCLEKGFLNSKTVHITYFPSININSLQIQLDCVCVSIGGAHSLPA